MGCAHGPLSALQGVHLHISVSSPLFKTSTQLPTNGALMSFLVQISQHFGSVTHLSFSGQLDMPSRWSNAEAGRVSLAEVMTTIAERFPALTSIHLGGVFRSNLSDLSAMLERLPQLEAIGEFCEWRGKDDVVAEVVSQFHSDTARFALPLLTSHPLLFAGKTLPKIATH